MIDLPNLPKDLTDIEKEIIDSLKERVVITDPLKAILRIVATAQTIPSKEISRGVILAILLMGMDVVKGQIAEREKAGTLGKSIDGVVIDTTPLGVMILVEEKNDQIINITTKKNEENVFPIKPTVTH